VKVGEVGKFVAGGEDESEDGRDKERIGDAFRRLDYK
jgi:hypothetical protein